MGPELILSIASLCVAVIGAIVSIVVAHSVSKREFERWAEQEQEKEEKRRGALIHGLKNQALLILDIAQANAQAGESEDEKKEWGIGLFAEIPTVAFETALVSQHLSGWIDSEKINKLLSQAYVINPMISYYRERKRTESHGTEGTAEQIRQENETLVQRTEELIRSFD